MSKLINWKTVIYRTHVNLEPRYLDANLSKHLEQRVLSRLCHRCIPQLGYVKHVEILKHSVGEDAASRSLGLVSYSVITCCQVCVPEKGMQLDARVVLSDTPGIIAINDELPLFKLNVPQLWFSRSALCTDNLKSLAQLAEGTHVRVQVEMHELRVTNGIAQYSVLCHLVAIHEGFQTRIVVASMPRNVTVGQEEDDGHQRVKSLEAAFSKLDETKHMVVGTLSELSLESTGCGPLAQLTPTLFNSVWDVIRMIINPREEMSARYCDLCSHIGGLGDGVQQQRQPSTDLTRAAAKIIELLQRNNNDDVVAEKQQQTQSEDDGEEGGPWIVCVAESPGGFLSSLISMFGNAYAYAGMSIAATDRDPGPWSKLRAHWRKTSQTFTNIDAETIDEISSTSIEDRMGTCCLIGDYGDVYGDITSVIARERLIHLCAGKGAWLVTADGGVTRDKNLSGTEERDLYSLALSETICAFSVLATNGTFVLKVFDVTTVKMFRLLQLLALCFVNVELTKPHTSRVANSERYVIASGFQRRGDVELIKMLETHYESASTTMLSFTCCVAEDERLIEQTVASIEEHSKQLLARQLAFLKSGQQLYEKYMAATTVIERESLLREAVRLNPNFQQ